MTLDTLSSVATHWTIWAMADGLGPYIRAQREAQGLSLTGAAAQMGIRKGTLSSIELGKIGLPSADIRRRIAGVLRVSHLDLLIAAGEITADEVSDAGKQGIVVADPQTEALIEWLRAERFQPNELEYLRRSAESMRELTGHAIRARASVKTDGSARITVGDQDE